MIAAIAAARWAAATRFKIIVHVVGWGCASSSSGALAHYYYLSMELPVVLFVWGFGTHTPSPVIFFPRGFWRGVPFQRLE